MNRLLAFMHLLFDIPEAHMERFRQAIPEGSDYLKATCVIGGKQAVYYVEPPDPTPAPRPGG